MRYVSWTIVLFLLAPTSAAQDAPFVKVEVSPEEVLVGEPVRLRVTVLGPTWFPQPPVFPSFEMPNAMVRLPPNSSRPTSERVGRETWSGIIRNYRVFPLVGASYRLDEQTMRVTYADPGRPPITVDVAVPAIEFRSLVPAGAETLDPYIAGRSLALTRDVESDVNGLAAGDALVVRYTAELDGVPAIFIPALVEAAETPGASVYADQPDVEDGEPARRSERLTYVFDAGGEFAIPAVSLEWWNTETSSIETAVVPALTVSVDGPPASAGAAENPVAERNWWSLVAGLLVLGLVLRMLPRLRAEIRRRRLVRRKMRLASEAHAFGRLRKALRSGDLRSAYVALIHWLDRLEPAMDAQRFAETYGDKRLREQLGRLTRALYSGKDAAISATRLERSLLAARRKREREVKSLTRAELPPLNP